MLYYILHGAGTWPDHMDCWGDQTRERGTTPLYRTTALACSPYTPFLTRTHGVKPNFRMKATAIILLLGLVVAATAVPAPPGCPITAAQADKLNYAPVKAVSLRVIRGEGLAGGHA